VNFNNGESYMKKEINRFCIRNAIEVLVLIFLLMYFNSISKISFLSLIPLLFVLLVFLFDFYKLYTFHLKQDLNELMKFQSSFLYYSFAWYFFPIFLSIYLILKNLNALKNEYLFSVAFIYWVLYLYNLFVSKKLKNNLI
jgi:hypothetical protein